jgi:hypothetical protein
MKAPLKWSKLYMTKSDTQDDDFDIEYNESDLETELETKEDDEV